MNNLDKQIDELESYISHLELMNLDVSNSSVGWQIEHSLLVLNGVIRSLKKSDPASFKWSFKPIKYLILWRKVIPRGKVHAPKYVYPDAFTEDSLKANIETCRKLLVDLDQLGAQHFFTHPIFGDLKKREAEKFLWIHTEHHLKIIREICG